ncbi:hypothetical protein MGG_17435, partial [Pyricularia oryzae 70-15]
MDHRCTEDKQKDAWAGPCNNLMTVRTYYAFFYAAKASLPVESLFLQDYLKMPRRGCPDPPLQCAFSRVGQNLNAKMLLDGDPLFVIWEIIDAHPTGRKQKPRPTGVSGKWLGAYGTKKEVTEQPTLSLGRHW